MTGDYRSNPEVTKLAAGGDVMAAAVLSLLLEIIREYDGAGVWDLPPDLMTVDRVGYGTVPEGMAVELMTQSVGYTFDGLNGLQIAWMLKKLAGGLRRNSKLATRLVEGRDILGWVLVHEGWMVESKGDADGRALQRSAQARQLHTHPRRVEARIAMAVDRAGVRYEVIHRRGGETTSMVDRGGTDRLKLGGDLMDGLVALAETLP